MTKYTILMNAEGWPGIEPGTRALQTGIPALDVVETAIKPTELEPQVRTVGFGGAPNALGVMQLDASIMNGNTLQTGAVGAVEEVMHPITLARHVMEKLPHVMLVGEGAQRFATECGISLQNVLSPEAEKSLEEWKKANPFKKVLDLYSAEEGKGSHGTVVTLVIDKLGNFAGGVSTSGWDYKYPGRLGDSPIIGAGMYIDKRFGGAACTHCGENAIRACLARSVVLYMKKGAAVKEAVAEGMEDLASLKGGYQGQVVIYAFDKKGEHFVARRFNEGEKCEYLIFQDGMSKFEKREAAFLS